MAEVGGGIEIMYQCCFYRCVPVAVGPDSVIQGPA